MRGRIMKATEKGVVLVEDDAATRAFITMHFAMQGIDIVGEAADGRTGSALAARLQPALVVLDLDMPVMHGRSAIPLIRDACPATLIVVHSFERDMDAASLSVEAFIPKDSPPEQLATTVRALLETSATPQPPEG